MRMACYTKSKGYEVPTISYFHSNSLIVTELDRSKLTVIYHKSHVIDEINTANDHGHYG